MDREGFGTINDDDLPPSLSISNVNVAEGNSGTRNANFTISLSAASSKTVTVQYATATSGSFAATAGTDYVVVPLTTLTFTPGQTTKTVTVLVKGDTLDEMDERFVVNLSSPGNATLTDSEGFGTIFDDDAAPSLRISDATVIEGNSGTKPATFTVSLSAASGKTVTVQYATLVPSSFAATPGADYVTVPLTTLTFLPGETSKTVTVLVKGDTLDEVDERFLVTLSNAVNATFADSEGRGTITDDDAPPLLFEDDTPSQ